MSGRTKLFFLSAAALAIAGPVHAQSFKQVATIEIPGTPINNYGVLAIDQTTGLGYLADKDNKAVVVFDTKTDKYVARITGFVGQTKSGNASGPNGLVVVNGGAQLWVSDGDSTVKVIDSRPTPSSRPSRPAARSGPMAWPSTPTRARSSSPIPTTIRRFSA